jgi:Ca2+/Na+ antiporter
MYIQVKCIISSFIAVYTYRTLVSVTDIRGDNVIIAYIICIITGLLVFQTLHTYPNKWSLINGIFAICWFIYAFVFTYDYGQQTTYQSYNAYVITAPGGDCRRCLFYQNKPSFMNVTTVHSVQASSFIERKPQCRSF